MLQLHYTRGTVMIGDIVKVIVDRPLGSMHRFDDVEEKYVVKHINSSFHEK